jgi:hypothetical protein
MDVVDPTVSLLSIELTVTIFILILLDISTVTLEFMNNEKYSRQSIEGSTSEEYYFGVKHLR